MIEQKKKHFDTCLFKYQNGFFWIKMESINFLMYFPSFETFKNEMFSVTKIFFLISIVNSKKSC